MRELTVDGVDEIALVRLPSINLASQAFRGEAGDGSFLVDDVAAAQSFPSLKIVRLIEDASGSDKHLYRGRVITKGFARGGDVADDARQITVGTVDSNWDLRRLRVHQWPRPSETGRARVVALGAYILNGSSSTATNTRKRPSTVIDVTTYVPNTNTVTMPANLYDATDPLAVIDDCARAEGKAYFVFIDDDGDMFLWYDVGTSTSYASTLAISDDAWDFSTVFPPADDGQPGEEDGTELLSGAGLVDSTGTAYAQQDAGIEASNDVAEETIFDNGAGPVDATNRLTAFLDERELEELRYACAVQLRAEDAHLIKAGMTIAFRWAAAGVTSPVTLRVARCAPEHIEPDLYLLHLELGFPEKVSARIRSHGEGVIVGPGPFTEACNIPNPDNFDDFVREEDLTWGDAPDGHPWDTNGAEASGWGVDGELGYFSIPGDVVTDRFVSATLNGDWDLFPDNPWSKPTFTMRASVEYIVDIPSGDSVLWRFKTLNQSNPVDFPQVTLVLDPDDPQVTLGLEGAPVSSFSLSGMPPVLTPVYIKWYRNRLTDTNLVKVWWQADPFVPGLDQEPADWQISGAVGLVEPGAPLNFDFIQRLDFPLLGDANGFYMDDLNFALCSVPSFSSFVNEGIGTGDGSTVAFFTDHAYRPGSLRVFVDDLREFHITETDPAAGEFTFDSAPFVSETIRVEYQAA